MDVDDLRLADFAVQLNKLYETLNGSASLEEPGSALGFISFAATTGGHIKVWGYIHYKHTQELTFENEFDQTYLKNFAEALFADYGKYAE